MQKDVTVTNFCYREKFVKSKELMQVSIQKEKLLTEQEAANLLQIPESILQALIFSCEIPLRAKGRRCYFSKSDLEAWKQLNKREVMHG